MTRWSESAGLAAETKDRSLATRSAVLQLGSLRDDAAQPMTLDERLKALLTPHGAENKSMFGGTCFLIGGNMAIGTLKEGLIVRVGKEANASQAAR